MDVNNGETLRLLDESEFRLDRKDGSIIYGTFVAGENINVYRGGILCLPESPPVISNITLILDETSPEK